MVIWLDYYYFLFYFFVENVKVTIKNLEIDLENNVIGDTSTTTIINE